MQIEFQSYGETLVARKLQRFEHRAEHARPAFEAIADTLRGYEERLFDSQGASGGATWAPIQQSTIDAKVAAGLDPRVLHATGALRRSLTQQHDPMHEEIATDDFLLFGSQIDYGGFHQRGEGQVRRRPLQYTEAQKRRTLKQLQRFLVTGEV